MTTELKFDFLEDKRKSSITVKREFAAKRQLVWDCHTKRELLDRWFAPKPLTTKTKHMEFRGVLALPSMASATKAESSIPNFREHVGMSASPMCGNGHL